MERGDDNDDDGDSDWDIDGNVDNVDGRDVNGAGRTIAGSAK